MNPVPRHAVPPTVASGQPVPSRRATRRTTLAAAAIVSALAACKSQRQPAPEPPPEPSIAQPPLDPQRIDRVVLSSGLVIEDLRVGGGPVCLPGSRVSVVYTGRVLPPGAEPPGSEHPFDSSGPSPIDFDLAGNMIEGWKLGLPGMRVGGRRRLTVPPELGYKSRALTNARGELVAPPYSTLVYDIDLVAVR